MGDVVTALARAVLEEGHHGSVILDDLNRDTLRKARANHCRVVLPGLGERTINFDPDNPPKPEFCRQHEHAALAATEIHEDEPLRCDDAAEETPAERGVGRQISRVVRIVHPSAAKLVPAPEASRFRAVESVERVGYGWRLGRPPQPSVPCSPQDGSTGGDRTNAKEGPAQRQSDHREVPLPTADRWSACNANWR